MNYDLFIIIRSFDNNYSKNFQEARKMYNIWPNTYDYVTIQSRV